MNIESRTTPVLTPLVRSLNKAIVASQLKVVQEGSLPDLEHGSYVLAPTHQHALDASVLLAMQPGDWRVMAAVERFQGPEAPLLRAVGAYPIDRDKPAPASIKETFRLMKEGTEVVMFPEGEIHTDGQVHEFKPGVARLSLKGGVDAIVPMALAYRDEKKSPILPALLGAGLAGAAWVGAQLSGSPLLRGLAAAGGLGLAGAALGKKLSGPAIDPNDVRFVSLMAKQIGYATAGLVAGAVGGALLAGHGPLMLGAALLGGGALGANLAARPEAHVQIGAPIPLAGYQDKDGQERLTADLHARMVELKQAAAG